MKDKKGLTVYNALKSVTTERKPKKLFVDKGKEFYNKHVQSEFDIYSTQNDEKASIAERFIRTIKTKMYKYFTKETTNRYIGKLDEIVNEYNNTKHRSIGMTPVEASDLENEDKVREKLYAEGVQRSTSVARTKKFKFGDRVRIPVKKRTFSKGYYANWTTEIFVISEVLKTSPVTYKLEDLNGEPIVGSFYTQELQKTEQDMYKIEKVLKTRQKGKKTELYVKWEGYPDSFNSWVSAFELIGQK